jgi:cyclophilin family peptidyl-prolyl cis-trans isomerase
MHRPRTGQTCFARRADACRCLTAIVLVATLGCRYEKQQSSPAAAPAANSASTPEGPATDPAHPVVLVKTNLGAITVQLDAEHAPGTVNNFLNYVTDDFYTNTIFHYVDRGNMILGGGYTADRRLKPAGMAIRNEAHNGLKNLRGTIAMARDRAAVDSATSQFFINLADAPQRDHQGEGAQQYGYCVFGRVIDGLDVADRISQSPTQDFGGDLVQSPEPPVVIQSIRVVH